MTRIDVLSLIRCGPSNGSRARQPGRLGGLTEDQALLVEKTLLHKLGKSLTNISSGHYADKFRPHDTLHIELPGFD